MSTVVHLYTICSVLLVHGELNFPNSSFPSGISTMHERQGMILSLLACVSLFFYPMFLSGRPQFIKIQSWHLRFTTKSNFVQREMNVCVYIILHAIVQTWTRPLVRKLSNRTSLILSLCPLDGFGLLLSQNV